MNRYALIGKIMALVIELEKEKSDHILDLSDKIFQNVTEYSNQLLNKAMVSPDRIKNPNSNNIAEFIDENF